MPVSIHAPARGATALGDGEGAAARGFNPRAREGAYSRPRLPLIPDEACHPFHAKAATDSTAKLPPWQAA